MKRWLLFPFVLASLALVLPASAQGDGMITLDDATPSIDVVISQPPNTTGTVSLSIAQAAVTMTDEAGNTVFHAADGRLHAIELNIAPNTGSHTLTIQRLAGAPQAYVNVLSLPELTVQGAANLVNSSTIGLNQATLLPLDPVNPGGLVEVQIPDGSAGVITANFPDAHAATRLVDSAGATLATSSGGQVDAMNLMVDGGSYRFAVRADNIESSMVAGVRAVASTEGGLALLPQPTAVNTVASTTGDCQATIGVSSVNLRSGPGTGYSVMGYGYRGETYTVGGRNPQNNWVVIGTPQGSSWIAASTVQLNGVCDQLQSFDIPFRQAQEAQIIVATPEQIIQNFTDVIGCNTSHAEDGRRAAR